MASLDSNLRTLVGNGFGVQRMMFRFVATAGQTTFSGNDAAGNTLAYTSGAVDVFWDGRLLSTPDFTATNGTSIVLGAAAAAGDEILIIAQGSFGIANTVASSAQTLSTAQQLQVQQNLGLTPILANTVSTSAQTLTSIQQDQVRVNLNNPLPASLTASTILLVSDIGRDQYITNSVTITVPNGGPGWISGILTNDNPSSGLVTIAVPNNATLDGVTNGTTIIGPGQRVRIRQTGTTGFRTDWVDRGQNLTPGYNGLRIGPGSSPNTQISITASTLVLRNASNAFTARNVSLVVATNAAGVNGLDTGTLAASTWYAIHVISNGSMIAPILSLSATAPTLPTGYTYTMRVGWARVNSAGNLVQVVQNGRIAHYVSVSGQAACPYPTAVPSSVGDYVNGSYPQIAIIGFAPPTTVAVLLASATTGSSYTGSSACPNPYFGAYNQSFYSSLPLPPINTQYTSAISNWMQLENPGYIYGASQQSALLICLGWEDNL